MNKSRWERVVIGMTTSQVQEIFGDDARRVNGFVEETWMVNNEADPNPDHGYMIVFDENGRVKSKGGFSCS